MIHIPVLQKEVLEYLNPKSNENFIDGTIGEAGHTITILERTKPKGKILGIEIDPELYESLLKSDFNRLILVNDSYANLKTIVEKLKFRPVHGILFDLGMSSWHLEESGRGFSFLRDEPLDMRYRVKCQMSNVKCQNYLTAEKIVNEWSEERIAGILKEYGEERFSGKIARRIIEERKINPIKTTFQLVALIKKSVPGKFQHQRIPRRRASTLRGRHCATRTFQALRIAVNDELNNLKKVLPQIINVLEKGGRLIIISFHSLEDRIVKNFFRENSQFLKILTKKPIRPSFEEIKLNPRSKSAKLRAAMKI